MTPKEGLTSIFAKPKLFGKSPPINWLNQRLKGRPLLGNITELLCQMETEKDEAVYLSGHIQTYLKQFTESNETGDKLFFNLTKTLKMGAELQTMDIPINWAVRGLVPQQSITLLSARGGMGKTILSISIANAVTKSIPFLGLKTSKMPVVYIDFENSLPTLVERVKRIDPRKQCLVLASYERNKPTTTRQ